MTFLQTYAPTAALIALTFFVVRGLLHAIWATLLRPAKNVKKYVRQTPAPEPEANQRASN